METEVTPPRKEEVILEVREVDKMILVDRLVITLVQIITVVVVGVSMVEISQGTAAVMASHLAIRVKTMVTLVETKENRGRGRGRFDASPNVRRPRVASKTIDKDKGRCFCCMSLECPKKIEDEKPRRFSRMDTEYKQDGQYSDYDDTGIYTDDYDDEVFATLNS